MTLKLTPDLLRAAYDLLGETEPFKRWNLPDSDEIRFRVYRSGDYGLFQTDGPDMTISASERMIGHLGTLLSTIAHEKIHVYQHVTGMPMDHGAGFKKLAAEVCRHHRDFDPKNF